jgi:class 3 adenylate cyclase
LERRRPKHLLTGLIKCSLLLGGVMERRLAAILAADVVGYSLLLMEQDEAGTLAKLKDRRGEILAPLVAQYRGRIVKAMGDGVLVEYASAVNALDCAVELQKSMIAAAAGKPEDRRRIAHDQPAISSNSEQALDRRRVRP